MMTQVCSVGAQKQRRKDDIAEAAGHPNGDKESDEHAYDQGKAHVCGACHQHKAG